MGLSDLYTWRSADFTLDRLHRWSLHRTWTPYREQRREVLFVMLNPSKAGKDEDDPTIRRCVGFAKRWQYTGVRVMNLFSLVATKPSELYAAEQPGPLYETRLRLASKEAALTVVAWGGIRPLPHVVERRNAVLALLVAPHCLGVTKAGEPRHPLYVPYTAEVMPYVVA